MPFGVAGPTAREHVGTLSEADRPRDQPRI